VNRTEIPVRDLNANICKLVGDGLLLTCGDFDAKSYNTMTIGWGSMGVIWGKPFFQALVRPTRYTYEFMERHDSFTVTAFSPKHKDALALLGSKSGRDLDKIKAAGLTPVKSARVKSPGFEEAELVIECRKIYFSDLQPKNFLADYIAGMYKNDYHRQYFGEILAVYGDAKYKRG
jgi:flavin reductase (DIM6/NTAB) family NADH-FMN oxidoreductase RutF